MGICTTHTKPIKNKLASIKIEVIPPSEKDQNEEEFLETVKSNP